jgi:hypothetical protein
MLSNGRALSGLRDDALPLYSTLLLRERQDGKSWSLLERTASWLDPESEQGIVHKTRWARNASEGPFSQMPVWGAL